MSFFKVKLLTPKKKKKKKKKNVVWVGRGRPPHGIESKRKLSLSID